MRVGSRKLARFPLKTAVRKIEIEIQSKGYKRKILAGLSLENLQFKMYESSNLNWNS